MMMLGTVQTSAEVTHKHTRIGMWICVFMENPLLAQMGGLDQRNKFSSSTRFAAA